MMRKLRIVLCLVVVVALFMQITVYATDEAPETTVIDFEHENEMNTQFSNLLQYFSECGYSTEVNPYPDFYGGAYIADDRSELIVCVTDDSEEIKNIIRTGTKNSDIAISKVTHSYNALKTEALSLFKNRSSVSTVDNSSLLNRKNTMEIIGTGVNVEENGVVVTIKNKNEWQLTSLDDLLIVHNDLMKQIKDTSRSTGEDFNYIIRVGGIIEEHITYNPGEYVNSSGGSFTMGFKGVIRHPITNEYVKGFWTAGHCFDNTGVSVRVGNTAIGTCLVAKNNGYVDAAFVGLDDQTYTTISSNLKYGGKTLESAHFAGNLAEGTLVFICGGATREEKNGTIQDSYYNFTSIDGTEYYDFFAANYQSINGDSGAVIYTLINGDYVVCGIHRGADPDNYARTVFTKVTNIADEWDMYEWSE